MDQTQNCNGKNGVWCGSSRKLPIITINYPPKPKTNQRETREREREREISDQTISQTSRGKKEEKDQTSGSGTKRGEDVAHNFQISLFAFFIPSQPNVPSVFSPYRQGSLSSLHLTLPPILDFISDS